MFFFVKEASFKKLHTLWLHLYEMPRLGDAIKIKIKMRMVVA